MHVHNVVKVVDDNEKLQAMNSAPANMQHGPVT